MTSDGKLPETSPDTLDDAFFSHEPVVARPTGAPVASSADDELSGVPDLAPDFDEDAVLGRKRGLHIGGFVLVFMGTVFGGMAGYFALRQGAAKETPVLSASASSSARGVAAPTISATARVAPAPTDPSAKTAKTSASSGRTASKSGTSGDPAGFAGPNSGVGPSGPSAATGELSAGEISGVVERNRPLLKRRCWQPEVTARQGMGGSARVNTSFTIGASGTVQSATASGAENDYPGLSSCIAARIREWKFPASAGSTPVNVPFVFAAQ